MAFDYRDVMSGNRRGPTATLIRGGLWVASQAYGAGARRKNRRFDTGAETAHHCGVPVISVGNLTTGGTGKTPIVCYLARQLRQSGVRVAIISRGYGRGDADLNDEAMELHARLPDVPHIQDADRVAAARIAVQELDSQLILMDDGFQHRRLHRDLDIVVVDATCPFGFGHMLPRGLLREPTVGLQRADLVILSRCGSAAEQTLSDIEASITSIKPSLPVIRSEHAPEALLEHPDQQLPIESIRGARVAVISAIGNPDAFTETVRRCGATIIDSRHLPDHARYDPNTVAELRSWIESLDQVDRVVCTHKDLVKLQTDRLGGSPVAALMIDLQIRRGGDILSRWLEKLSGENTASAPSLGAGLSER